MLEEQLQELIYNSFLREEYYKEAPLYAAYQQVLNHYFNDKSKYKNIVIRGAGEHTFHLINAINNKKKLSKIKYILDREPYDCYIPNMKIVPVEYISGDKVIDVIIISALENREAMKRELVDIGIACEIIDIYEILINNGIEVIHEFYSMTENRVEFGEYKINYQYVEIMELKNIYKNATGREEKEQCLKKIICAYLRIYDFVSVFKWLIEYINNFHETAYLATEFKVHLEKFFNAIQLELQSREQQDIIINLLDALDPEDTIDYLKEIEPQSVQFQNSYTTSKWTKQSIKSMFLGEYAIEGHLFNKGIDEEVSAIKYFKEQGYCVNILAFKSFMLNNLYNFPTTNLYETLSELQWETIKILFKNKQPCFIYMHSFLETHSPFLNGDIEELKSFIEGPSTRCAIKLAMQKTNKYISSQLRWNSNFYSENSINIYLSDHGKFNQKYNNILLVKSKRVRGKKEERMFSMIQFINFIKWTINMDEDAYEKLFLYDIKIEELDVYNFSFIEKVLKMRSDYTYKPGMAYKSIISSQDRYIIYADGEEVYTTKDQSNVNQINDAVYADRVNKCRSMVGSYFISIKEEPYFKHTCKLYEKFKYPLR